MSATLVLLKNPNLIIPETEIIQAVTKFPACYGMAGAGETFEDIDVERGVLKLGDQLKDTVSGLMDNQQTYLDAAMVFFFSATPLSPESQQPFVIHSVKENGKDVPLVVGFIPDGDYSKHAEPSSAHSPEFFAFAKFLRPKMIDLFNNPTAEGDPEKVRQLMDGRIEEIVNGLCGPTDAGAATIMFYDGKSNTYVNKSTKGETHPWGWKSASWAPAQAIVETPPQASTGRRRRSLVTTEDPTTATSNPSTQTAEPVKTTDANVINANFAANGTKPFRARPKNLQGKALRRAYATFNLQKDTSGRGIVPTAWKARVGIEVDPRTFANQRDYFLSCMEIIPDTKVDPGATTAIASSTVPTPAPQDPPNVSIQIGGVPLIMGDEKNELIEYWNNSKYVNEAKSRTTPYDLQNAENKYPPLDYYFPLTMADLKKHSPESLAEIINEYPDFALLVIWHALHPAPINVPGAGSSPAGTKPEPEAAPAASSPGVAPPRRKRSLAA